MRPHSNGLRERVAAAGDHHEGSRRKISRTFRVSLSSSCDEITGGIRDGVISADGRGAAFSTKGAGVVPDDTNRVTDVFLRGPLA